jgi:RND superfamily putative drug exporter
MVAILALALLTLAFRTILVPIKSLAGFLLSAFAAFAAFGAFGAEVAVFQWGWARQLFGIAPSQTIGFLPILMLVIKFGLSSDYEVFLVSRIKEDYTRTGDSNSAVERGTILSTRVALPLTSRCYMRLCLVPGPVLRVGHDAGTCDPTWAKIWP